MKAEESWPSGGRWSTRDLVLGVFYFCAMGDPGLDSLMLLRLADDRVLLVVMQ
jgi:hypothetical protein